MRGRGRRDMARQIGRWRHHRPAEGAQDGPRDRVGGNPDRDGIEPGGGEIGDRAIARSWAAPASAAPARTPRRARSPVASKRAIRRAASRSPTWAISGIEGGPALGLVEPGDRGGIGGIGAEAIDGLGRERDQAAFGEAARGRGHGGLAGRQNLRCQAHIHGD